MNPGGPKVDVREGLQSKSPAPMLFLPLAVGLLGLGKAGLGHGDLGPCVLGALRCLILSFEIALKLGRRPPGFGGRWTP